MNGLLLGLIVLSVLVICFIPAIIAISTKHPQAVAIVVLNFFLGWTLIGWVIALVWACTKPETPKVIVSTPEQNNSMKEIEKLAELKEKGIISQEEFEKKKSQILGL